MRRLFCLFTGIYSCDVADAPENRLPEFLVKCTRLGVFHVPFESWMLVADKIAAEKKHHVPSRHGRVLVQSGFKKDRKCRAIARDVHLYVT